MFYSHEILSSREYGVATIWLVSTLGIGKVGSKKVPKKAIQEVNVAKACNKIVDPGAPIALRLQGQLLHGVARVHERQCDFVLSDAQKVYATINLFLKSAGKHLDPKAAHSRPENLVIHDDPSFLPNMDLPNFELFDVDAFVASQASRKTSSQMTPRGSSVLADSQSSAGRVDGPFHLDLHHSDSSVVQPPSQGPKGLSSAQKPHVAAEEHHLTNHGEDGEVFADWGIDIDDDGNLFEVAPTAPAPGDPEILPDSDANWQSGPAVTGGEGAQAQQIDDGLVNLGDEFLPEPEAFRTRQAHQPSDPFQNDQPRAQNGTARRGRKPRRFNRDEELQVSRGAIRNWQDTYSEKCCFNKFDSKPVATTSKQARDNAMQLTFGFGLGSIGIPMGLPGIVSPLATTFSGDSLFTAITGLTVPRAVTKRRGRPRKASDAFPDNEVGRRVKPRLETAVDDQGLVLGEDDAIAASHADDTALEVGREIQEPLPEHPSSAMRSQWNKGSSVAPGSSVGGHGSAQRARSVQSSPLAGRADAQYIARHSDDGPMDFGDDGFSAGFSQDDAFHAVELSLHEGPQRTENTQQQNQALREALNREGRNFMSLLQEQISIHGVHRDVTHASDKSRWINFDEVFPVDTTDHATAAQAFYHALSLATRGKITLDQPYGIVNDIANKQIWMGTELSVSINT